MPFEMFTPGKYAARRRQGPAKLTVEQTPNGRTTIRMSAAVRDWLGPSRPEAGARYPDNRPRMKVAIMIDREARQLMIVRRPDEETGDGIYDVHGLSSGSTAYLSDWGLDQALDLKPGHYPAELLGTEMETSEHGIHISLDERVGPQPQKPKASAELALEVPVSVDDAARIFEIRAVLDEGVTIVG